MGIDLKLDHGGMADVLKSAGVAAAVNALAERVAENVLAEGQLVSHGEEMPVTVDPYTTDRASASVTITHPAGLAVQAKHGTLTRAAAAAGLEVRSK